MKTTLEEIDATGKVQRSLTINEGNRIETIDTVLTPAPGTAAEFSQ
jgi:hypothetical protein